jgi:Domain of unknown function (DUF4168)
MALLVQAFFRQIATILLLVLLCGYAAPSWADPITPPEAESIAPAGLNTDSISPEKINQFIHAYLQVTNLIEQREGEVQAAETDSESQRIQQDIEAEAIGLIEAESLTLQEYLQLLGLANLDPDFSDRIALQLQEAID